MTVPYRTGLPTLHRLMRAVCGLLNRYYPVIVTIIPAEKVVYVNALRQACTDFIDNVPNPRP